jgi:glycine/D-amino acid oxidase-like deaminating enzyme
MLCWVQVYEPADQLHLYGLNPLDPTTKKQYIATGDSGQGMTGGTIAGILIPALIAGEDHRWKEVWPPALTYVNDV